MSYRVSDGTADEGASVLGEATIYLLPALEAAPITVDDSVVVRAGEQSTCPSSTTTCPPRAAGPASTRSRSPSSTPDALAFASGDVLRYLAPDEPGQYTVDYRAFTTGSPALGDIATVHVRAPSLPTRTATRCRRACPAASRAVCRRRSRSTGSAWIPTATSCA